MIRTLLTLLALTLALPATAQDRIPSHCVALSGAEPQILKATFREPLAPEAVRITYLDHSMFLIQTPDVAAMTDFTGWYGNVDFLPDVVTMNNAHSTHWTAFPDPGIPHVLEGWANADGSREHFLDLGEMLVRNVHSDVRGRDGGRRVNGNSIFIFEAGGLCIGHLGHLHQPLSDVQHALIGRLDVVMVAVDGGLTLDHETVVEVMDRFRASVVIPMHWFGRNTLDAFLARMEESGFAVDRRGRPDMVLTLATLPPRPTVMVLDPRPLSE